MASPQSQGCCWSKKNILRLLESIESNIQSNHKGTFKTTQSQLDWEKIGFQNFSGEMCKQKWLEISCKLRKFHTWKELVVEAKKHAKDFSKGKIGKNPPDFPKKPLTAYIRFYKEKWPQYSQMYPELSNQELTKVLAEKYKQLPEQIKQKYFQDFQKEKEEYEEKLAQFRKEHPGLVQDSKKSDVRKRCQAKAPKKLQGNGKNVRSLPKTDDISKKVKFKGEPKKPPMNGYHKFQQDSWSSRELRLLPPRERMVEISRRWQRVPQSLKEQYKSQAEELQKQYRLDLDRWLKSLSPQEYAAYKETTYGKHKNMTRTAGPNPRGRELQCSSAKRLKEGHGEEQGPQAPRTVTTEMVWMGPAILYQPSWGSKDSKKECGEENTGSTSSDSSSGDEDENGGSEGGSSSSSSSDLDSI